MQKAIIADRKPISLGEKINPLWWLVGPDGWSAPEINDGGNGPEPYLPTIQSQLLRNLIWWTRNPAMNLAGFVLGIEDKNYTIWASDNPLQNSGRDCQPTVYGLRWAALFPKPQWCTVAFLFGWTALAILVNPWFTIAWAFTFAKVMGPCPFVNYYKPGFLEAYIGWRPGSGGFGVKLVKGKPPRFT